MEGISKVLLQDLHDIAIRIGDLIRAHVLSDLIRECKELPDQQWQTIEEFKANPVDDWVHICFGEERNVDTAYYRDGGFWWCDMSYGGDNWNDVEITHVMPIKTPEAPK